MEILSKVERHDGAQIDIRDCLGFHQPLFQFKDAGLLAVQINQQPELW